MQDILTENVVKSIILCEGEECKVVGSGDASGKGSGLELWVQ